MSTNSSLSLDALATPSISRPRKPKITYKSPSSRISGGPCIEASSSQATICRKKHPLSVHLLEHSSQSLQHQSSSVKSSRRLSAPPFPLFHPFGALALSLPELDATALGLPPLVIAKEPIRSSSSRTRKPPIKPRGAEDASPHTSVGSSDFPSPPAQEIAAKSPRKRRTNGSSKRKRQIDDGDATYPAKRTRNARSGALANSTLPSESPPEALSTISDATPVPDLMEQALSERNIEKRTKRSRHGIKRRGSSSSVGSSSTSAAVSAGAEPSAVTGQGSHRIIKQTKDLVSVDGKEDGEISEPGTSAFD